MYAMTTPTKVPDPETLEKPRRRYHKAAFKREILKLADNPPEDITKSQIKGSLEDMESQPRQ